ncbi:jg26142 [Pararge aegeria aegeria]|uniref:Jg26142 protein n=1 Tax=Pararge aegeria aegeria TaxID=348720 RepID=A0A8S4S260_9NEOP|nr:jg26142 [Pararge aegeria aegeria]
MSNDCFYEVTAYVTYVAPRGTFIDCGVNITVHGRTQVLSQRKVGPESPRWAEGLVIVVDSSSSREDAAPLYSFSFLGQRKKVTTVF